VNGNQFKSVPMYVDWMIVRAVVIEDKPMPQARLEGRE
jgi:hypothetical protein